MEVIRGTKKLDHTIVDEMTEYIDKPDDIIDSYDKMDAADEDYKEDIDNEADSDNETKDDNKADMDNKGDINDEAGSNDIVDKDNDAENNDIGGDNAIQIGRHTECFACNEKIGFLYIKARRAPRVPRSGDSSDG